MYRIILSMIIFIGLLNNHALATTSIYKPIWDSVCGIGTQLEKECEEIRDRQILNASSKPWSAIGQVNYAGYKKRQHCTGTLISNTHVITAAHCLFDRSGKKWLEATNLHFVAGYQRGEYVQHSKIEKYIVPNILNGKSTPNFAPKYDWAILKLAKPIGKITGFIDVAKKEVADIKSDYLVDVLGYPSIRRFVLSKATDCNIQNYNSTSNILFHNCSVMPGDSGGPIITYENGKPKLIAISTGVTLINNKSTSIATLIRNIQTHLLLK